MEKTVYDEINDRLITVEGSRSDWTDDLDRPAAPNPKQQYGDAKLPVHWVPPAAICAMAQGLGEGGRKYGPYNWRDAPVETMTYYAGAVRHLMAWLDGEDIDPDSKEGKTHLAGAIASLAILIDAIESGYAIDNRPKKGAAPRMLLKGARDATATNITTPAPGPSFVIPLDDLKTELQRVTLENAQLRAALKQKQQEDEACRT